MAVNGLRGYLEEKRAAILRRRAAAADGTGPDAPTILSATVRAEGRSGVRRIRIRDFQILMDTPSDFAGYNFGPGSPELQIGVLGSCLTHIFLIKAAEHEIPLDELWVDVQGQVDYRAGRPGFETVPVYPHNIAYIVHLDSPATDDQIAFLHQEVEKACPVLNLLANPQTIVGSIVREVSNERIKEGVAA